MRRRVLPLLGGFLCAWAFSFGIAQSLVSSYLLDFSPGETLLYSLLFTAAFGLVFYNAWTLCASLGLLALSSGLLFFLRREIVFAIFEELSPLFQNCFDYLRGADYLKGDFTFPLALAFCAVAALFAACTALRFRGVFIMTLTAAALFIAEFILGHENIFLCMSVCACSCIAVFCESYAAKVGSHTDTSHPVRHGQTALMIIPAAALALTLSYVFMPADASQFISPRVQELVTDTAGNMREYTGFSDLPGFFAAQQQREEITLGGPAFPGEVPVMTVRLFESAEAYSASQPQPGDASSGIFLRGEAKEVYTGRSWQRAEGLDEFNVRYWQDFRQEMFYEFSDVFGEPEIRDAKSGFMQGRRKVVEINPLVSTKVVYAASRMTDLAFRNEISVKLRGNGDMYADLPLLPNLPYAFECSLINWRDPAAAENIRYFEAYDRESSFEEPPTPVRPVSLRSNTNDPYVGIMNMRYSNARETCLGLPDTLPQSVYDEAEKITKGLDLDFDKAAAIESYLRANFKYTLTPRRVPTMTDFVEEFLESREGYCTYFATAMAILCRTQGIPSRYVEGYTLNSAERGPDGSLTVTGRQNHAWTEVFIRGTGWLVFDATAGRGMAEDAAPPAPASPAPSVTPPPLTPPPAKPPEAGGGWGEAGGILAAVMSVLILAGIIFLAYRFQKRRLSFEGILQRTGGPEKAVMYMWRDMHRILRRMGLERSAGETSLEYARRASLSGIGSFTEAAVIAQCVVYGDYAPAVKDAELMFSITGELERMMRLKLGAPRFFAYRRIFRL